MPGSIPQRPFGSHADVRISALGLGGHHLGHAPDERAATRLVQMAIDGGVTFFDNCWEYHRGRSELWMGKALAGRRDDIFLMSKVCTHGRDGDLALEMLGQTLRRLRTDHLDLWQVHGVSFDNDPELFIRKGGAAEALMRAKREGLVRFVGFTGHKDPAIHLRMLETGFPFDAVQLPLNPFDASFRSFERQVLPELVKRDIAALGMKPMGGTGAAIRAGRLTAEEALRYAMSLPVATTIAGMETASVMEQNLGIAQEFTPMTAAEMRALRARCRDDAGDGHFELYKTSLRFDNPEARLAHQFPLDEQQVEVREMLAETANDGHPYTIPPNDPKRHGIAAQAGM
jgi:aryl-alcohol dehydrogenase-like predicted oxidoreductase